VSWAHPLMSNYFMIVNCDLFVGPGSDEEPSSEASGRIERRRPVTPDCER